MTVHPFIEAEKQAGHSVKRACELLKVSRAAFYARRTSTPGPRAVQNAELTEQITAVHAQSRSTYGAQRIHAVLRREGMTCGRRRIARLKRAAGLAGRHRRRRHRTTVPDPQAAARPDLVLRDFRPDPTATDTRWCGDITHIPTDEGWLYLTTVIDIASRRVVGWATADHLRTELVADALRAACHQRRPADSVIFHSARGCQYTSQEFVLLAAELDIRLSVGRTGQCWDNALAESFFATLKNELIGTQPWPSRSADLSVPGDSCDEFPFAGTKESGALNGVTHGKDCAQVTAVQAGNRGDLATDWPTITPVGTFTGNEKCVRGHIPRDLNTDLGGAYSVFVKNARLADNDPFWLRITF